MPLNPLDPTDGIGLCPSPPHRAILGLTRAALGPPSDPQAQARLIADLKASPPDALVAIAFDTYVHVIVAAGFDRAPDLAAAVPDDLVIFFREMRAANLRRNEAILAQIRTIGAELSEAGLSGIVLKGGAELVAPLFPDPGFRFLSDVDILLPEEGIDEAVAALNGRGARAEPVDPALYRDHPHAAPLSHPDWPVPVELHRAIGRSPADLRILPVPALFDAARATPLPGLTVPAPVHRLAHSVLHAQIQTWRHREHVFSLRDAVEFAILNRVMTPADISKAQALFTAPEDRAAWEALDASQRLIFGAPADPRPLPAPALNWARTALDLFGRPKRQKARALLWTARRYLSDLAVDPVRRRHHLHQILRPSTLRRTVAHHRKKFRRIR